MIGLVVAALVGALARVVATVRQTRQSQQAKATSASPMTSSDKERVVLDIDTAANDLCDVVKERMPPISEAASPGRTRSDPSHDISLRSAQPSSCPEYGRANGRRASLVSRLWSPAVAGASSEVIE